MGSAFLVMMPLEIPAWLKPSPLNVVLALVLFGVVSRLFAATVFMADYFPFGFPLAFEESWGPCPPGGTCSSFNPLFLALDLLAWYLFTCATLYPVQKK